MKMDRRYTLFNFLSKNVIFWGTTKLYYLINKQILEKREREKLLWEQ